VAKSVLIARMSWGSSRLPPAGVAIVPAVLMCSSARQIRKVYAESDWPLLVMFAALIVVADSRRACSQRTSSAAVVPCIWSTSNPGGLTACYQHRKQCAAVLVLKPFVGNSRIRSGRARRRDGPPHSPQTLPS